MSYAAVGHPAPTITEESLEFALILLVLFLSLLSPFVFLGIFIYLLPQGQSGIKSTEKRREAGTEKEKAANFHEGDSDKSFFLVVLPLLLLSFIAVSCAVTRVFYPFWGGLWTVEVMFQSLDDFNAWLEDMYSTLTFLINIRIYFALLSEQKRNA